MVYYGQSKLLTITSMNCSNFSSIMEQVAVVCTLIVHWQLVRLLFI